jgi:histidinol-phosphatase (PHP family)
MLIPTLGTYIADCLILRKYFIRKGTYRPCLDDIWLVQDQLMIIADYHVHSDFSSDGKATMEQMIEQALRLGLKTLCFTDHMDYDYPLVSDYSFVFEIGEYRQRLEELKVKYRGRIELLTGVELGLQPHIKDRMDSLVKNCPFDFVIGSSHVVDHIDPYYPEYWQGASEAEGIQRYFQSIIDNCNVFDGFQVYGHLDYIVRYTPSMLAYKQLLRSDSSQPDHSSREDAYRNVCSLYTYQKYADILDEVLKTILAMGKGIEVNTSGLKYGLEFPHPRTEILKRYKELGGELITIGSDAHMPEHLCYDFSKAEELLKSLGFKYYAIFRQGKPYMEKL